MQYDQEYWDKRLDSDVPEKVKIAIKRIYRAYPKECLPQGECDPMYIMNVICLELGVGNGQGVFNAEITLSLGDKVFFYRGSDWDDEVPLKDEGVVVDVEGKMRVVSSITNDIYEMGDYVFHHKGMEL